MERRKRILVVDDEAPNRKLLEAMLSQMGHEIELASDGFDTLAKLKRGFDLVLLDLRMPGMDGFEVVRQIRGGSDCPDIPICMVTSLSGRSERLRAIESGANDFVGKPVDMVELQVRTAALLKTKEAQDALKRHQEALETVVAQRTEALRRALLDTAEAHRKTYQAQIETIERLALAAEHRDKDTAAHIKRMSHYCHLIAGQLNLPPSECEIMLHASPMHDVGKIGIPDAILLKPGKLDEREWAVMRTHAERGAQILDGSSSELLQAGAVIALSHHEKWNGTGYPQGLAGEAIPLFGRIAAVADVFDALTNQRPYKPAFPNERAREIMNEGRAMHFDPQLLDLFFGNYDDVLAIQKQYRDSTAGRSTA